MSAADSVYVEDTKRLRLTRARAVENARVARISGFHDGGPFGPWIRSLIHFSASIMSAIISLLMRVRSISSSVRPDVSGAAFVLDEAFDQL